MNRSLMVGQSANLATEAHELASEAGEAIKASRDTIKAAPRGMGAASDIQYWRSVAPPGLHAHLRRGLHWGAWPLHGHREVSQQPRHGLRRAHQL
jgi:hypothetical protein